MLRYVMRSTSRLSILILLSCYFTVP